MFFFVVDYIGRIFLFSRFRVLGFGVWVDSIVFNGFVFGGCLVLDGKISEGEKSIEGGVDDFLVKMEEEEEEEEESFFGCILFIKNFNFDIIEETLKGVSDVSEGEEGGVGWEFGLLMELSCYFVCKRDLC